MRILYIIDTLSSGGKERRLVELLTALEKQPEVKSELVVCSKKIHYKEIEKLNIRIHLFDRRWSKDPSILLKIWKVCKRFKPQIIHCWESMACFYSLPIAKILKIKFMNGMIVDAPPALKPFSQKWIRSKLLFPFSDIIVANSKAGILAYNPPSNKIRCIYNGFNMQRIYKSRSTYSYMVEEKIKNRFAVGMVASFSDKKDYKTFIEAALLLLEKRSAITFIAVGEGESLEKTINSIPQKFKSHFLFTGRQADVESIVKFFDIGVLSTHGEGISNAILEYMALSKPVIATDGGGTSEVVIDEYNGFLIPPFAPAVLATKIEYLLDNPSIAKSMGKNGFNTVRTKFSIEAMTDNFLGLYRAQLNVK